MNSYPPLLLRQQIAQIVGKEGGFDGEVDRSTSTAHKEFNC